MRRLYVKCIRLLDVAAYRALLWVAVVTEGWRDRVTIFDVLCHTNRRSEDGLVSLLRSDRASSREGELHQIYNRLEPRSGACRYPSDRCLMWAATHAAERRFGTPRLSPAARREVEKRVRNGYRSTTWEPAAGSKAVLWLQREFERRARVSGAAGPSAPVVTGKGDFAEKKSEEVEV